MEACTLTLARKNFQNAEDNARKGRFNEPFREDSVAIAIHWFAQYRPNFTRD